MAYDIQVPYLHNDELARQATCFLQSVRFEPTIPLPIERIVESVPLDIVPFANLKSAHDVDGFLNLSMQAICVDEYQACHYENRYRFTLAHELGHLALHREILDGAGVVIESLEDYLAFQRSILPNAFVRLEWQANAFAGLLLMPIGPLSREIEPVFSELKPKAAEALQQGASRKAVYDQVLTHAAMLLAPRFLVSEEAMRRRLDFGDIDTECFLS